MTQEKITEIRHLVDLWYDGDADPELQQRLVLFFAQTDPEQLPDDLKAEVEVFRSIGDLSQTCPDTALTAEIDAAVQAEKRRRPILHRVAAWSAAIAAAAVVAVVVTMGLKMPTTSLDTSATGETHSDSSIAVVMPTTGTATVKTEKPVDTQKTEAEPAPKPTTTAKTVNSPAKKTSDVPEGYTEVTDPQTVILVMKYVSKHSEQLISKSAKNIEYADNQLKSTTLDALNTVKKTNF